MKFISAFKSIGAFSLSILLIHPQPAAAKDWVEAISNESGWLVTGGLINHKIYEQDRTEAATCDDCYWWVHPICNSWDDENHGWCPSMRARCPADMQIVEIFNSDVDAPPDLKNPSWKRTGYSCVGEAGPISFAEIRQEILESKLFKPPSLKFTTEPADKTIVNLPLRVTYQSPISMPSEKFVIAKASILFTASASRGLKCDSCRIQNLRNVWWESTGIDKLVISAKWRASFQVSGLELDAQISPVEQSSTKKIQIYQIKRILK